MRKYFLFSNLRFQTNSSLLLFVFLLIGYQSFSQTTENKKEYRFGTVITVTNKGISTIPNLTLGKPAVLFDFVIGGDRLSFEPSFRFAMEGKPWSFLFWWRYKLVESGKMHFHHWCPSGTFISTNGCDQKWCY